MAEGIGLPNDLFSGFSAATYGTVRAWYKADALALNDGDAVASWTDSSGNARHATQSTGANKPLFKKNVASGYPALLFDGTNDTLATASFTARAHPVTVFVVAKRLSGTNGRNLVDGIGASNRMDIHVKTSTGIPRIYSGTELAGIHDVGDNWFVIQAVFNTTSSSIGLNDIFQASGDSNSNTLTGITIGSDYQPGNFWNGYIAEAIYFDGALSFDNNLTVRNYLQAKYAIPYFQPSSVSGLRSWFSADHIRDLKDSDAVVTWVDVVSGFNVTQATSTNRPLFKKNIQNHRPVLRFDGSNDRLQSASLNPLSQPRTIFIVGKHNNTAAFHTLFDGIASGNRHAVYYDNGTGKATIYAGTVLGPGTNDMGTAFVLWTAVFNTTSSAVYKNGISEASGAAGSHTLTGYTVGAAFDGSSPLNGDIAEILVYDGVLATTDRQRVDGSLRSKYGI